jgi:hypothetical protein
MGTEIEKATAPVSAGEAAFNLVQREAKALSSSNLMPKAYQGNIPNTMLAMEIANRIGAGVFQVAQNLHIIQGKPSFSASFLIATVNASGRWTPLKFRMVGTEGKPDWGCRAYATDKGTGEECVGPAVTMAMAKAEGWSTKQGSKWVTMPELMLHYRAAAFWTRLYAPELAMGIHTTEEVRDMQGGYAGEMPAELAPGDSKALEAALLGETIEAHGETVPTREPGDDGDDGRMTEEQERDLFGAQKP